MRSEGTSTVLESKVIGGTIRSGVADHFRRNAICLVHAVRYSPGGILSESNPMQLVYRWHYKPPELHTKGKSST